MCGIVGYIGWQKAQDVVMNGLEKLEYRGYDSSGIATILNGQLKLSKYKGRLSVLSKHLEEDPHQGHVGTKGGLLIDNIQMSIRINISINQTLLR